MLSKETVIIITVCSAITLLLIVLVISSRYSPPSAPLPTIQPLAHHREQLQNSLLESSSQLLVPSIGELNNSTACLLPTTPPPPPDSPDRPSRHQSPSSSARRSRSAGSHGTKNSCNRYGVPHGPHSQIQIMLPAPLALNAASNSTLSIVDKWASASTRKPDSMFHAPRGCHDNPF